MVVSAPDRVEGALGWRGQSHVDLAMHAVVPMSLTPELLYLLWARFQGDTQDSPLSVPWIAVSDIFSSGVVRQVGSELFEPLPDVRRYLLGKLVEDPRFGRKRLLEVASFVDAYASSIGGDPDPDVSEFASAVRWSAKAFLAPDEMSEFMATVLTNLDVHAPDAARIGRIVEEICGSDLGDLSAKYELVAYARAVRLYSRGSRRAATQSVKSLVDEDRVLRIGRVAASPQQDMLAVAPRDVPRHLRKRPPGQSRAILVNVAESQTAGGAEGISGRLDSLHSALRRAGLTVQVRTASSFESAAGVVSAASSAAGEDDTVMAHVIVSDALPERHSESMASVRYVADALAGRRRARRFLSADCLLADTHPPAEGVLAGALPGTENESLAVMVGETIGRASTKSLTTLIAEAFSGAAANRQGYITPGDVAAFAARKKDVSSRVSFIPAMEDFRLARLQPSERLARMEEAARDDLDGTLAAETVRFGLDGTEFEINVSEENATEMRAAFSRYVQAARRVADPSAASRRRR